MFPYIISKHENILIEVTRHTSIVALTETPAELLLVIKEGGLGRHVHKYLVKTFFNFFYMVAIFGEDYMYTLRVTS